MTFLTRIALVVLAATLVGGCTSRAERDGPIVVQGGAPGQTSRELSAEEVANLDIEPPPHTQADVAFMQGMIVHHGQALDMTALVPDRTTRDDLPLFAERMEISQRDEIDLMTRWLQARGESVPEITDHSGHGAHAELMPGMLTPTELAALRQTSGRRFDRLFLISMQRHHLGALQMVADLFANDGGQEPEIAQFANHVDADQRIELDRIATMLADIDTG